MKLDEEFGVQILLIFIYILLSTIYNIVVEPGENGQKEARVGELLDRLKQADGELIRLEGKKTRLGEEVYISARYGEVDSLANADHLLLVDVFANENGEMKPIGHYDWEISGDQALGNKNRHGGHLQAANQAHSNADRTWTTGEAFKVYDKSLVSYALDKGGFEYMNRLRKDGIVTDESQWQELVYQRQGLGGLMVAVSAVILESKEIATANLGTLTPSAKSLWKKFNQEQGRDVVVAELIKDRKVNEVLSEFLK